MVKIKLNLVSGAVVEKPLISAFKANNDSYVVLDNEMNGSMGLPIILVSKFDGSKLIKIEDQVEWQNVKEYLKNIIAGSKVEYITIANELPADDIYYTQLTLPVPSFDILKSSYKVESAVVPNNEIINSNMADVPPVVETPQVSVEPTPVVEVNPSVNPISNPNVIDSAIPVVDAPQVSIESSPVVEPVINNIEPQMPVDINPVSIQPEVQNTIESHVENSIPEVNIDIPQMEPISVTEPEMNSIPNVMENPTPVIEETSSVVETPVAPVVDTAPVINPVVNNGIFSEQKEAFMKACENMFDALVQKFEKELENRK